MEFLAGLPSDNEEEGGESLLGRPELSGPIVRLVEAARSLVRLSAKRALAGAGENDKAMLMMVTCAQASSEQLDSLACAAYEGDLPGLLGCASSIGKLLSKLAMVMSRDCGLAEDAGLREAASEAEAAVVAIHAGEAGPAAPEQPAEA